MTTIDQSARCSCGRSSIHVQGPVIGRFFCHCTICQSLYQEPCADVTIILRRSVTLPASHELAFRRYKSPPALQRGLCRVCRSPVVGLTPGPSALGLAFLASRTCERPDLLPPPQLHVFYHRKIAAVEDTLPKISGYWRSEAAVGRMVMSGLWKS